MEIEHEIISGIRRIIRAIEIYSLKLKEQIGLNSSQLTCLDYLHTNGAKSISELSKLLNLSPSMLTSIIDQLESRFMVQRVRSDVDRRKIRIELTEMGIKVLENSPMILHKRLKNNLSYLSNDEKIEILTSIDNIVRAIQAEGIDSSPILETGKRLAGEPDLMLTSTGEFKAKN